MLRWDELRAVQGIVIEVWEYQEDACSQIVDVDVVLTNGFEMLGRCGTSVVATTVYPVIVVRLNDEPLPSCVIEVFNMGSIISIS